MISKIEAKNSEKLAEELFDIFYNVTQQITQLAGDAPEQIVESVHLIRKRLKFLRAFVKLTRFCTEEKSYKPVNYLLRDSGRLFSDCRDAHVRGLLLDELIGIRPVRHIVHELIGLNDEITKKIEGGLLSGSTAFNKFISDISNEQITNYFESLEPDADCLTAGIALGYEKSYHAFHSELKSHESDLLHEWRKRTKDLQYQLEALLDSIPNRLAPSYEEVAALCEILGRINDLFMFLEWLDSIENSIETNNQLPELRNKMDSELKELENQADKIGHALFVMTPDEFNQSLRDKMNL